MMSTDHLYEFVHPFVQIQECIDNVDMQQ